MAMIPLTAPVGPITRPQNTGVDPVNAGARFQMELARQVAETEQTIEAGDAAVKTMVASQGESLHETMIALEEADLSLRLTLGIGQRLVRAYQEISHIQV